ncbi:ATP-binding protein [Pseudobacteriovorax antillogorgiicola]|uniref:histidine kinase n=1 Tax=Pseudobacteriovorax antillogorgiicola TaxID=1513793 RepID=A0A1Y6CP95_9BACT|nr:ATP-binding protein [Pseudobacteriovorax antillogorgiicola]TCS43636.1 Hpt domain-containing protein [Pseudobacteriovorax antillogorgiicola]SMF79971.1 Hpt domain-containing protein [Pseudobacteriovorax antillogorgiicola]
MSVRGGAIKNDSNKSPLIRLTAYFTPKQYVEGGFDARRRSRLLIMFSVILFLFGGIYATLYEFRYGAHRQAIQMYLSACLVIITPFVFKYSKSIYVAGNYMLILTFTLLNILLNSTGALYGSTFFWFPLIPSVAVILLGPRLGILWGALSIAAVSRVFIMQLGGVEFIHVIPENLRHQSNFTSYLGLSTIIPLLFGIYEKAKNKMLAEIHDAKREIVKQQTLAMEAHKSARVVLDNVSQALLLVDRDGKIHPEYSKPLETWFGAPQEGDVLWTFIGRKCPDFANWLELAWLQMNDGVLEPSLCLKQIPKDVKMKDGSYLEFDMQTLDGQHQVNHHANILIVISDITDRVKAEIAEESRRELLVIFEQLTQNREFTRETLIEIEDMIKALNSDETTPETERRLLHTLKGSSAVSGLISISRYSHSLEDKLMESRGRLSKKELDALHQKWNLLMQKVQPFLSQDDKDIVVTEEDLENLRLLVHGGESEAVILDAIDQLVQEPLSRRFKHLAVQIEQIAMNLGKGKIEIKIEDGGVRLPRQDWTYFWGNFIHAIRNAVDHGLETPMERKEQNKPESGQITLSSALEGDEIVIRLEDDGRGIDWDKIRARAKEANLPYNSDKDLLDAMFHDGITSRDSVSDVSGRGVGLAALKQCCDNMGGRIVVASEPTKGTRISFYFKRTVSSSNAA